MIRIPNQNLTYDQLCEQNLRLLKMKTDSQNFTTFHEERELTNLRELSLLLSNVLRATQTHSSEARAPSMLDQPVQST